MCCRVNSGRCARCRIHTRRQFVEAEASAPTDVAGALNPLAALYRVERDIEHRNLKCEKKHGHRVAHSKPLVDDFLQWCENQNCDGRAH
jgi:hypothetical protein